jgi:2,5-diamino-6-(ribosylamino)-4(3H)-pyrimidinone 5'-phosphate reductase
MSVDGKLALPERKQTKISSEEDMKRVYELRGKCDAVMVGVGTVLTDNPGLVVKLDGKLAAKQPLRVVLDSQGRTPADAEVLDGRAPSLIAVSEQNTSTWEGTEVAVCGTEKVDLKQILKELSSRGVEKVLVEGGGTVIWSFLSEKLVDDMYVYIGSMVIGGSSSPTLADGEGAPAPEAIIPLALEDIKKMEGGVLMHYKPIR